MRILVLNPNTSASMTAEIGAAARAAAAPGTEIHTSSLGVPCVDGVATAVGLAQMLVGLGLSTSKSGVFAAGPDNPRSHWPLSAAVGARR